MTITQFNNAITLYCEHVKAEELGDRFIATIGGKNLLYSKTGAHEHNFEVAKNLGLTPIIDGFLNKSEDGTWGGFGESTRQEFMQYLINQQIIPV